MTTQNESHVFGADRRTEKWAPSSLEMFVEYQLTHGGPGGSCHTYTSDLRPFGIEGVDGVHLVAADLMAARRLGSEAVEKVLVEHGWLSPKEEK